MKMTKTIAVLLSLVMILGTMPMMAFAAANTNVADAIADVMGMSSAEIIKSHVNWGVTNLDFTDANVSSKTGMTIDEGITLNSENGAVFPAGSNLALNYTNVSGNVGVSNVGWGPLSCSDYLHIRFKLEEEGSLTFRGENTYRGNEFFVRVIPALYVEGGEEGEEPTEIPAVSVYSATDEQVKPNYVVENSGYEPGTEWNDILIKKDNPGATSGGYSVYMKKVTDEEFTLVATAPFFQTGTGSWGAGSLTISGRSASVLEANNYIGSNNKYFDSVEEIMGITSGGAIPQLSPNYDFTASDFIPGSEIKYLSTSSYDGVPVYTPGVGATIDGDVNSYMYFEYAANPCAVGTATIFAMKHTNETDKTMININTPDGGCTYATIAKDKLTSNTSSGNPASFAFGTDPFELLYLAKEEGYAFYARNEGTNNRWVELTNVSESRHSSLSRGAFSIAVNGATDGVVVSSIRMYGTSKYYHESIEEIMGGELTTTYFLDFDADFDDKIMENSGATMTTGLDYSDEYGLDLNDGAWSFSAYKSKNWSPLNGNLPGETYVPQALYFKMKFNSNSGETTLTAGTPDGYGRLYRGMKVGSALNLNGATGTVANSIALDTNWAEHLIVPSQSVDGGYTHYVKSDTVTNGKWVKAVETTNYRDAGTEKPGTTLTFSQTDACIKSIKTYQVALAEDECKPQNATLLYYDEDFVDAPDYGNLTVANGNYDTAGVVSFPAVDNASYGKYVLNYAGIPVGGYAEFKTNSNGTIILQLNDGVKRVGMNIFKPYIGLEGTETNYFFGDGMNVSRIWRVERTESGYTFYAKAEGDKGWKKFAQDVGSDVTGKADPQIVLTFRNHSDGTSVGSGTLDYLKIYGPAREEKLIVTDGYGTKELKEGDSFGYGSSIRPIVNNATSGKVIVANYQKKKLVRLTVLDVSEMTVDKCVSVAKAGTDDVKIFLWEGFGGAMANATEALTLKFPASK